MVGVSSGVCSNAQRHLARAFAGGMEQRIRNGRRSRGASLPGIRRRVHRVRIAQTADRRGLSPPRSEDHRLAAGVEWLRKLEVKYLRTGISWADWFRPNAETWFDRQMEALDEFTTTMTLCFTPEHLGQAPHYTSPPKRPQDFAQFAEWAVGRYAPAPQGLTNAPEQQFVSRKPFAGVGCELSE